jgi:SLOG in TRPM, prokaryote
MTAAIGDANGPRYVRVDQRDELPAALRALAVRSGRPVLVSVGGASGMTPEHLDAMAALVRERVVPALDRWGAAVVDGGTDAGVMRVMGQAHDAAGVSFPLIGVAAAGTVVVPDAAGSTADAAELEPHHTHVVLVPGDSWGDESPWLSEVATVVAGKYPSATLVINGGEITYEDVSHSLAAGRPVIVVAGAGRTADAIAAAAGGAGDDVRAARLAASPLVRIVRLDDPDGVASALEAALGPDRTTAVSGGSS